MRISLVLATVGRHRQVFAFCESLNNQSCDLSDVELIIVDQNDHDEVEKGLRAREYRFRLVYKRISEKGLSNARNIGRSIASGVIIGYPDDDCLYYPNTIAEVAREFRAGPEQKLIVGRIFDRDSGKNIIKKWPSVDLKVTLLNYYRLSSSITLFHTAAPDLPFDKRMGAGRYYGSAEDVDFVYRWLLTGRRAEYTKSIEVWHDEPQAAQTSLVKVRSYSRGLGYFIIKKHDVNWPKWIHLFLLLNYKLWQCLLGAFRHQFPSRYFVEYSLGLLEGTRVIKK
jgi:glycosyltransferase involved in cell wall biosynthesis